MQRLLIVFTALAVAAALLPGCCVSPGAVAPPHEPTPAATGTPDSGDQSRSTATPTPSRAGEGQAPSPTCTPEATLPYEARGVIELAKEDLARRLEIPVSEISVISVEAVDWPDTSLGCPEPGMAYAPVITPGYLIVLGAESRTYEYHSGGEQLLLCGETATGQSRPDPVVTDGHPWMPRDTDIEPTWPRR